MVKHTPGPWVWNEGGYILRPQAYIDDALSTDVAAILVVESSGLIARPETQPFDDTLAEIEANKRLIAASPELLEIVRTFDAYMGHAGEPAEQDSLNPIRALRWTAQQAIAKAVQP